MTGGRLEDYEVAPDDALFFDFDGTLAEIGPDPDAIGLETTTAQSLARLAAHLGGALAVLSGRGLVDLAARTPPGLWRAGGHGLDVAAPGDAPVARQVSPPREVLDALAQAAPIDGVRLELKGAVAALHYRAAPDAAAQCIDAATAAAAAAPGYRMQAGKMVVEVKPQAAHKGEALERMMAHPPFAGRRPVMFGDDTTDEDAIAAAQALGGLGVKVGAGETVAHLRIDSPAALRRWIARQAERVG